MPPWVLASGPKPCGGNDCLTLRINLVQIAKVRDLSLSVSKLKHCAIVLRCLKCLKCALLSSIDKTWVLYTYIRFPLCSELSIILHSTSVSIQPCLKKISINISISRSLVCNVLCVILFINIIFTGYNYFTSMLEMR